MANQPPHRLQFDYRDRIAGLSEDGYRRIQAGLLEVDARWHERAYRKPGLPPFRSSFDSRALWSDVYAAFAGPVLEELGGLTDEWLTETLPSLSLEAVSEAGWDDTAAKAEPSEHLTLRVGGLYVAPNYYRFFVLQDYLAGAISRWRAASIRKRIAKAMEQSPELVSSDTARGSPIPDGSGERKALSKVGKASGSAVIPQGIVAEIIQLTERVLALPPAQHEKYPGQVMASPPHRDEILRVVNMCDDWLTIYAGRHGTVASKPWLKVILEGDWRKLRECRPQWIVQNLTSIKELLQHVAESPPAGAWAPSAPENPREGSVDSQPQRKRGRPTRIPDELKRRALAVRGGKERAKIIYETNYPTAKQIKNVCSILRHFKRTHQLSE